MNIKDKLKFYHPVSESEKPKEENSSAARSVPQHWKALARNTGGAIIENKQGYFYYSKKIYDLRLNSEYMELLHQGLKFENISLLSPDLAEKEINLSDILFFDLETSGLSGGAGTLAFLIGAAQITSNCIIVHQWVMPDFADEHLILSHFNSLLKNFNFFATYNGKSFDAPIIKNRFILNRIIPHLEDKTHIDFLHIARRLWKDRLQSCTLQNLEREILNIHRVEDIPGELIPSIYFRFLYGNGLEEFKKILEHNYFDLVYLIQIAIKLEFVMSNPEKRLEHNLDYLSLIKFLYKNKLYVKIERLVLKWLHGGNYEKELFFYYGKTLRKLKKNNEAADVFLKLLNEKYLTMKFVEEYTIVLEHTFKDYQKAIEIIENKLESARILAKLSDKKLNKSEEKLILRLTRLKKKFRKSKKLV